MKAGVLVWHHCLASRLVGSPFGASHPLRRTMVPPEHVAELLRLPIQVDAQFTRSRRHASLRKRILPSAHLIPVFRKVEHMRVLHADSERHKKCLGLPVGRVRRRCDGVFALKSRSPVPCSRGSALSRKGRRPPVKAAFA